MSDTSVAPIPVFNHVAMSLPADQLGETGRTELLRFYGEVFGWTEGDNSGETGNPLIMLTGVLAITYLPWLSTALPGMMD